MTQLQTRLARLEAKHEGPVVFYVISQDENGLYQVNNLPKMTAAEFAVWDAALGPDVKHIRIDADTVAQNGG